MLADLGDGLVMRRAVAADSDELVEFNARVHGRPGEPSEYIGIWTRALLSGRHPQMQPSDFLAVEDTRERRIVSTMNLISQTWTYEGIPFGVGRIELVGTDDAYRRRGLIRRQFDEIHRWSAERGELVQAISGIPWYYRQFGYEYALDYSGGRFLPASLIRRLDRPDGYSVRQATAEDAPFIAGLIVAARARVVVSAIRSAEFIAYDIGEQRPTFANLYLIVERAGRPVAFVGSWGWSPGGPPVLDGLEVADGESWLAVRAVVLDDVLARAKRLVTEERPLEGITLSLGLDHPAYAGLERQSAIVPPDGWYIRVPDLRAFLGRIAPALERRLAASPAAGWSGDLKLSFYREGLVLRFVEGRLDEIGRWQQPEWGDAHARFPDLTFLQLLFGRRSLAELESAYPDADAPGPDSRAVVQSLFPKRPSFVWPVD